MAKYDRYNEFRVDGQIMFVPFIEIDRKNSDFYETYRRNKTRLDRLSYDYYGDSSFAWLIMQANPEYGSMEFEIPDGSLLRIPYPLDETITRYIQSIENYNKLY